MASEDRELEPGLTGPASTHVESNSAPPVPAAFDEPTLLDVLWSEPYRFEFFAALRIFSRLAENDPRAADEPRTAHDRILFRAHQSLSFPASEIWDLKRPDDLERLAEMTVAFFGLTGPMGALPRPYSVLIMERIRKKDFALRDFLDIFNHRLITIFAKAGEKYRYYLTHELASARERWRRMQGPQKLRGFLLEERGRIDLFSQILLDLGGLGTPLLRYKDSVRNAPAPRLAIADTTLRYFSGHLAQTHRTGVALARILSEYFRAAVQIIPFVGQWIQLPVEHQTCMRRRDLGALSGAQQPVGVCADPRLGHNTVVGSRVWEVQGRFRVRLGPLSFEQFQHFLPIGGKYRSLAHFVRLFVGAAFDFDVQPVLEGREVPWCQMGATGARAPRLGWNTWIRNQEFSQPVDDAIFRVPDEVSLGQ
jgi:type VI secretion system protein ImpH